MTRFLKRALPIHGSIQELKLNPFTLSFAKDYEQIEKGFRHAYFDVHLNLFRLCHAASIFLYGIFGILDAVLFPQYAGTLWFIRFGVVVPVFVCGFFFTFHSGYRRLWPIINNGYVILTGASFTVMIALTPPPLSYWYVLGVAICQIFGYTFIRSRFLMASVTGWSLNIIYALVSIWIDTPRAILINNIAYVTGINILGMVICYSMEISARRDFFLRNLLETEKKNVEAANAELEKRVRERTMNLSETNELLKREMEERAKRELENRELETKLNQAHKMETIGTLAGGIAHDFNNILSSVLGFAQLSLEDVEKGTILEDNLQEIYAAGRRAKDLVDQILTFARQGEEEVIPVLMGPIIKEALKLLRASIPSSIEIRSRIESRSPVMANPINIHQILMNLCSNASYAMQNGGLLEVKLEDARIDSDAEGGPYGLESGKYVMLTVTDNGEGIPEDVLGSVFDPFFTTKGPGEGTGMGLSVVHGIVKKYGGRIAVESEPGEGTSFSVYLPVTGKTEEDDSYSPEALPRGSESILFVDDELSIAHLAQRSLQSQGYRVTVRTSSVEALELFRAKSADFDLVVTDMTMPNMTGDQLAAAMMKIRPAIPVVVCTGYSTRISEKKMEELGIKALIFKPITKADLAKTARKVLDEAKKQAFSGIGTW